MIGFCERILAFIQGADRAEFLANAMRYDATVRNIELAGEEPVGLGATKAKIGPSEDSFCRICRPIARYESNRR